MKKLGEIKIFQRLDRLREGRFMDYNTDLSEFIDIFTSDLENIERYTYRVEKTLKELATDLRKLHNDPATLQAALQTDKETIEKVKSFSNVLLGSVLKLAITNSLDDLGEKMDEYFAVLPLPFISNENKPLFPAYLIGKQNYYRRKLLMDYEEIVCVLFWRFY